MLDGRAGLGWLYGYTAVQDEGFDKLQGPRHIPQIPGHAPLSFRTWGPPAAPRPMVNHGRAHGSSRAVRPRFSNTALELSTSVKCITPASVTGRQVTWR